MIFNSIVHISKLVSGKKTHGKMSKTLKLFVCVPSHTLYHWASKSASMFSASQYTGVSFFNTGKSLFISKCNMRYWKTLERTKYFFPFLLCFDQVRVFPGVLEAVQAARYTAES